MLLIPHCGYVAVENHKVSLLHYSLIWVYSYFSLVFFAGRMVDFPGYSLSGAVASFFLVLLTMRQPGRMPVFSLLYTPMPQQYSPHAEFQIKRDRTILD